MFGDNSSSSDTSGGSDRRAGSCGGLVDGATADGLSTLSMFTDADSDSPAGRTDLPVPPVGVSAAAAVAARVDGSHADTTDDERPFEDRIVVVRARGGRRLTARAAELVARSRASDDADPPPARTPVAAQERTSRLGDYAARGKGGRRGRVRGTVSVAGPAPAASALARLTQAERQLRIVAISLFENEHISSSVALA